MAKASPRLAQDPTALGVVGDGAVEKPRVFRVRPIWELFCQFFHIRSDERFLR